MGGGRFTADDWDRYSSRAVYSKASVNEIYTSSSMPQDFDPRGITIRESCDSTDNPESTPIIIALDVTGSMDPVLNAVIRTGLPTLTSQLYERRPISDPHLMFMAVGDSNYDLSPLQVTQFEADIRIAEQLTRLFLERGGGGNGWESYLLPLYFAATRTKIDSFDKRGKKGYLFTVGDESPEPSLTRGAALKVFGETLQADMTPEQVLQAAQQQWEVFHIMIEEGNNWRSFGPSMSLPQWRKFLGDRALLLNDHTKIGEVILSAIQTNEGQDPAEVAKSWTDPGTAVVVARALNTTVPAEGVIRF